MKKTFKPALLFNLIVLILLSNLVISASAADTAYNVQIPLEQRLIGTWRWESPNSSWIIVFREDGTMLDGPSFHRTIYNWQVIDDRLIVNGIDWNIRVTDNTITLDRRGRSHRTYTYVRYSDSTEGETSARIFYIIAAVIVFVIVTVSLIAIRVSRRRRQRMQSQSQPF